MELYGFNILSLNEQMEVVNQLGTFIDNRIEIKEHCNLYAVGMFYVEVAWLNVHVACSTTETCHKLLATCSADSAAPPVPLDNKRLI
jgi:hypothetical protein